MTGQVWSRVSDPAIATDFLAPEAIRRRIGAELLDLRETLWTLRNQVSAAEARALEPDLLVALSTLTTASNEALRGDAGRGTDRQLIELVNGVIRVLLESPELSGTARPFCDRVSREVDQLSAPPVAAERSKIAPGSR